MKLKPSQIKALEVAAKPCRVYPGKTQTVYGSNRTRDDREQPTIHEMTAAALLKLGLIERPDSRYNFIYRITSEGLKAIGR